MARDWGPITCHGHILPVRVNPLHALFVQQTFEGLYLLGADLEIWNIAPLQPTFMEETWMIRGDMEGTDNQIKDPNLTACKESYVFSDWECHGWIGPGKDRWKLPCIPRLSKLVVAAYPRVYMYVIIKILKWWIFFKKQSCLIVSTCSREF